KPKQSCCVGVSRSLRQLSRKAFTPLPAFLCSLAISNQPSLAVRANNLLPLLRQTPQDNQLSRRWFGIQTIPLHLNSGAIPPIRPREHCSPRKVRHIHTSPLGGSLQVLQPGRHQW
mgnify:CR=1